MDKPNVPKFGSFKPRPSTKQSVPEDTGSTEHTKSEGRERSSKYDRKDRRHDRDDRDARRNRHHVSSSRDRSHDGHHNHHRRRSIDPRSKVPSPEHIRPPEDLDESDLFFSDRRGDSKNATYGSLHRYSIPAYRTAGYGNVIGVSLSSKLDREESNEKEVVLKNADREWKRTPRILASKQGRLSDKRLRFVLNDFTDVSDSTDLDFIGLSDTRKRKRETDFSAADLAQAATADYRSIEGKAKRPTQPEDEDLALASDSETADEETDISLQYRQQNAVLSKQAKATPAHWESWLALVDHQAKLVRPGIDASNFTTSERKTLADLRLSILSEATRHITKSKSGREDLLLTSIEEGRHIWDSAKRAARWKEALSECPGSTLLWTKYLDFIQHSHSSFLYENCRDAYLQCLKMLQEAREEDGADMKRIAEVQIFVLLRLTTFVRDAGYDELAIATWQAVLDLHLTNPEGSDESIPPEDLTAFENFWESEAPRLGEEGATGWFYASTKRRDPAKPESSPLRGENPFSTLIAEETRLRGFILPATMDDEDATLDPFRCVMFDDIRDILESFNKPLPKMMLVQALLLFLGLPLLPGQDGTLNARSWLLDQHLHGNVGGTATGQAHLTSIRNEVPTTNQLFTTAFDTFALNLSTDTQGLPKFTDNILSAIIAQNDNDKLLSEYLLAFQLKFFPAQAAKIGKRMLKGRPTSLRLYNAFALVQAKLTGVDAALNIWSVALGLVDKLEASAKDEAVLLWHSRLHAQLRAETDEQALHTLLMLADPSATKSGGHVEQLKTIRHLEEMIDRTLLSGRYTLAVLDIDCLTWLQYLVNNHSHNIALDTYAKYAIRLQSSPIALEQLHQSKAHLLQAHIAKKRPYKPAALLSDVSTSLKLLPNNSLLLSLHAQLAAQDRLRALFRQETTSATENRSIIQWSHHIATEIETLRKEAAGATINSVRASFRKALLGIDSEVSHAPSLWMAWLQFEYDLGLGLEKVKQVFLDGMRYLPWHKQWVIEGMRTLIDGGMSRSEMRQVFETMVERGLRLRVDIEDLL